MFIDFTEPSRSPCGAWTELPDSEALLLWSLRRMVIAWPRCHAVHAALHRHFGDNALGYEALLRCWLCGLASHATRQLRIGDPACAAILTDESRMLDAIRWADDVGRASQAIDTLCGRAAAANLYPVAQAIARFSVC